MQQTAPGHFKAACQKKFLQGLLLCLLLLCQQVVYAQVIDTTFAPKELESKDLVVTFSRGSGKYVFDEWDERYENISLINNKKLYERLGSYRVPCKLVPPGKTDRVGYELNIVNTKMTFHRSRLMFKTGAGVILQQDSLSGEVIIPGGKANDAQDLYVLYPDAQGEYRAVGKLKVLSYPLKSFKVKLVPLRSGGQSYSIDPAAVQSKLDEVYGPLGITWEVTQDSPFDYSSADLISEGSDLLSIYSDEMKTLNSAYRQSREIDKQTVYLFVMNRGEIKGMDIAGDMPRGKQFGYLFTGNSGDLPLTVAHELGHGRFQLRHTFDSEYGGALPLNSTRNLMDYAGGIHLAKWQWDEIFSPAILVSPFEGDEDAMAQNSSPEGIVVPFDATYVAPNNLKLKLKKGVEILYKCDYEDHLKTDYLYKFKINNKIFESRGKFTNVGPDGYNFEGYYCGNEKYPLESSSVKVGDEVVLVGQYFSGSIRKLSARKVKIKEIEFYAIGDKVQLQTVIEDNKIVNPNCNSGSAGEMWKSQINTLEKFASKLQSKWDIEINDESGNVGKITKPGSKGKLVYAYKDGSWKVNVQLDKARIQQQGKSRYYKGEDLEEVEKIIEAAIKEKINKFSVDETGGSNPKTTTTQPVQTEDGGEFRFGDGLNWLEWGATLTDAGVSIYERAALPKTYWDQADPQYGTYPLHAPPTLCGVGDGVIDEVTAIPQLVKLGLEVTTDKEKALAIWNSVKKINLNSIKNAASGAIKEKWDKYANSQGYVTYHEMGKDGVAVASMLYGGFATKGKNLAEAVEETGETIGKKTKKIVIKSWDEAVEVVDDLLKFQIKKLNQLYPDAKIGYRGSLATGKKYSTGGPFDPADWDVDAFIVCDDLAKKFTPNGFRDGKNIQEIRLINDELETAFKNISGYRTDVGKPFTFRIWAEAEFNSIVKPNGCKLFE